MPSRTTPDPDLRPTSPGRRRLMGGLVTLGAWSAAVGGVLGGALGSALGRAAGAASAGRAVLERLPGKWPLRRLTHRPPNYETPIGYLRTAITPNEAFFVRYHHAVIPEIERVLLLKQGQLVGDGPPDRLLTDAPLSALFDTPLRVVEAEGWRQVLPG